MINEIARYLIVGIGSNLLNFLTYSFLYIIGIEIFIASFLGYLFGLAISYTFGRIWVFGKKFESSKRTIISFMAIYFVGGLGMSILIFISTEKLGFDYRIGWLIGATYAVINNFFGQKFFVFSNSEVKNG